MLVTRGCEEPLHTASWILKEKNSSFLLRLLHIAGEILRLFCLTFFLNGPWFIGGCEAKVSEPLVYSFLLLFQVIAPFWT